MTQRNALMEWLEQTKKMSKMVDYICSEAIDWIVNVLWLTDGKIIRRHKGFFDYYCAKYHKPHPLELMRDPTAIEKIFMERYGKLIPAMRCVGCRFGKKTLTDFVESSILRCKFGIKDVTWQWYEIIDFMYERPELVNPAVIDEYIEGKIYEVCGTHKKNNPLKNGMKEKFGKFFKGEDGKWHHERRRRF